MGSARDSAPDPKRASGLARPPWTSRVRPRPMSGIAPAPSNLGCRRRPCAALRGLAPPPAAGAAEPPLHWARPSWSTQAGS